MPFKALGWGPGSFTPSRTRVTPNPPLFKSRRYRSSSRAVTPSGSPRRAPARQPLSPGPSWKDSRTLPRSSTGESAFPGFLILLPTRELAAQVEESLRTYGKYLPLRFAAIYGGVSENPQIRALRDGVDVIVATPGRLLDLMSTLQAHVRDVQILVLDEADRMLDMGFIPDIRRIVRALPFDRQTLLFSATFSPAIEKISQEFLKKAESIEIGRRATPTETVAQFVFEVPKAMKPSLLLKLLDDQGLDSVLVFTRTKHAADRLSRQLSDGGVVTATLHSNRSQNQRMAALKAFKSGEVRVLVATDIAARGIDVDGISHVVNFDFPAHPEDYVHRIGRTGRAKAIGDALSFATPEDLPALRALERFMGRGIPRRNMTGLSVTAAPPDRESSRHRPQRSRQDGGSQGRKRPARPGQGQGQGQGGPRRDGGSSPGARAGNSRPDRGRAPAGRSNEPARERVVRGGKPPAASSPKPQAARETVETQDSTWGTSRKSRSGSPRTPLGDRPKLSRFGFRSVFPNDPWLVPPTLQGTGWNASCSPSGCIPIPLSRPLSRFIGRIIGERRLCKMHMEPCTSRNTWRWLAATTVLMVALGCAEREPTQPLPINRNELVSSPQVVILNEDLTGTQIFPVDNWWNLDISLAPLDTHSQGFIDWISGRTPSNPGATRQLHPDFGPPPYGMPYVTGSGNQALLPVTFVLYGNQSDAGAPGQPPGYPIPIEARTLPNYIEGGVPGGGPSGDRHLLIIDRDHGFLFETWATRWNSGLSRWEAGSGAVFNLATNDRRPDTWTSADAAGLAIFPGLIRWDEYSGPDEIEHAFRFTTRATNGYVWPASHVAGSNPAAPPMGTRLRMKASTNISGYPAQVQKIFRAMKRYGLILADNGTDMYIQGTMDGNWDNDILNPAFHSLHADDFEVIELGWKPLVTGVPY